MDENMCGLLIYETYFSHNWLPRLNQILTPFEVHPQLSNNMTLRSWVADSMIFLMTFISSNTFWSLLRVYDHHQKDHVM
jgi:hypothetical protein